MDGLLHYQWTDNPITDGRRCAANAGRDRTRIRVHPGLASPSRPSVVALRRAASWCSGTRPQIERVRRADGVRQSRQLTHWAHLIDVSTDGRRVLACSDAWNESCSVDYIDTGVVYDFATNTTSKGRIHSMSADGSSGLRWARYEPTDLLFSTGQWVLKRRSVWSSTGEVELNVDDQGRWMPISSAPSGEPTSMSGDGRWVVRLRLVDWKWVVFVIDTTK